VPGGVELNQIILGDCRDILPQMPDGCVDLLFHSEHQGTRRGWGAAYLRSGDDHRNAKTWLEVDGRVHLAQEELLPGKWPNRFRDAWERCLHFTKRRQFAMYQDAVRVPMGNWRVARLKNLSETDKRRDNSRVDSGFGKKIANWVGRDWAYPTNVLYLATECGNQNHSATFPVDLPAWFIRLFTQPGDVVLDPFVGSGSTAVACVRLGRYYLGIDVDPGFVELARRRVEAECGNQPDLFATQPLGG